MILYWVILNWARNKEKSCSDTNQTLWDYLRRRKGTISEMVQDLVRLWYIKVLDWTPRKLVPMCKDIQTETHTSEKKDTRTAEQKENFETLWKIYPHYQSRSVKKNARVHFLEKDFNEMLFSAKIQKRKIRMKPEEQQYVKWCHLWIKNFEAMPEFSKKMALREIYKRHMSAGWDMRTRFEEILSDFPEADFSEFREELSKEKTEYAIWHLIHWSK